MYFREFGIPARIGRCFNIEQLEEKVKKLESKVSQLSKLAPRRKKPTAKKRNATK